MTPKSLLWLPALLAGATLAVPMAPANAASDFQLPPSSTSAPRPQGPVDAGAPPPRVATPAPTPAPTRGPVPVITVPDAAPTVAVPVPSASSPAPAARPAAQTPGAAPSPAAQPTPGASLAPLQQDTPPLTLPSDATSPAAASEPQLRTLPAWWPIAAGGLAVLAILAAGAFLWLRRREKPTPEIARPAIERPVPAPQAAPPAPQAPAPEAPPPPAPPPAADDHGPLSIAVEARAMTISIAAATLAYRITLTNTGDTPLGGVAIAGDMVSAHASLALEDQLATPGNTLAQQHAIERIKPGESVQVTGEFRLPFQAIRVIQRGKAAMFVPLARLRVETAEGGNGALIRTALVGQRAATPGGGLQPFRLDLGPRIYREVTQKIF